jgi:hypothetical protein
VIVVFAVDALEYDKVLEYGCRNLMQQQYGKTDISEFSQPRTMVLWSSFMTGENKEKEILSKGDKLMWETKWRMEETFFSKFKKPLIIDLPGFSYDKGVHDRSRELLKNFFSASGSEEKKKIREEYNADAFAHHRKIKEEFLADLDGGYDFLLGYFSVADVVGHLSFGNNLMMKMIYRDLDELASEAAKKTESLLVLSDHGMQAVGEFGDHSGYGFWSTSWESGLSAPKITEFAKVLAKRAKV